MRLLPVLLVSMLLLGFQVQAQPVAPAAMPPQAHTPAKSPAKTTHHRVSWQQRFAAANTTHDGHLTQEQAKAGDLTIARHFTQIDTGNKGYVTQDDIAAWHKMQRQARHHPPGTADNTLRPRPAVHRTTMRRRTMTPTPNGMANGPTDQGGNTPPAINTGSATRAPGA
ncbi:MAG TPA: hypothetical protein VGG99_12150 [Acetobacteraceae bacterium]